MGLFGGTQLQIIRDYSQHSLEYALLNRTNPIFEANRTNINCFIEQYYAYYMVRKSSISEAAIHNPARYEIKKKEEIADFNLCEKSVGFSHYLGKSKQNYYVIDFIHKELSKNFRNDYERIHQYLKNGRCKKNYFARVNDKININDLYEDLITRLNKCHYYIDDELKEDYKQYLRDRLFLLNKKLSNNSLPISTPSEVLTMRDLTYRTKVRLNDNFLLIKKYLCPWSEMYKAENFVYKEKIITKDDINIKYPTYCIYALLPSEQSLPSVWVDNITAYFIYKVLSKEYQAIEIIQEKLNRLLKDDNQTLPLKYIINLLGTVNKYKILDFSNE